MTTREEWDARFLHIAKEDVATWSKDPDEKVGCVLVSPDRREQSSGYNGFPQHITDSRGRLADNHLKNRLMVHAELNAILNARRNLTGWTLYVTKPPCFDCAKAIIQAGIARVVCPPVRTGSRWLSNQQEAAELLREGQVAVEYLS